MPGMHKSFHTCIIIYTQILMAGKEFRESLVIQIL